MVESTMYGGIVAVGIGSWLIVGAALDRTKFHLGWNSNVNPLRCTVNQNLHLRQ